MTTGTGLARRVAPTLLLAAPLALLLLGSTPVKKRPRRTPTRTPMATPTKAPPSANEVIRRMAEVYATCRSYRDEGAVGMTFHEKSGDRFEEKPFTTEFIRPSYFRFEYRTHFSADGDWLRNFVWLEGGKAWTWLSSGSGRRKEASSLDRALAPATGASGGSAHRVPKLLMPAEITGRTLVEMKEPKLEGTEAIEGKSCYRLTGLYAPSDPRITIWIETDSFLLRRVSGSNTFPDFSLDTVTVYSPAVNVEVERRTVP